MWGLLKVVKPCVFANHCIGHRAHLGARDYREDIGFCNNLDEFLRALGKFYSWSTDPEQIPINVLEFIGVFSNFANFGPLVPSADTSLLVLTDSLTSALVVVCHSARSDLMQIVHQRLLNLPEYKRLATGGVNEITQSPTHNAIGYEARFDGIQNSAVRVRPMTESQ